MHEVQGVQKAPCLLLHASIEERGGCVPGAPAIACHPQLPGEPHQPISGTTRSADLIIKRNQTPCICLSNQNTTSVLRCVASSSWSNRFNGIFRVTHLTEIKNAHTRAKGYARDIHTRLTTADMQMLASQVIKGATHALDIPPRSFLCAQTCAQTRVLTS